jgi:hypothetical protein
VNINPILKRKTIRKAWKKLTPEEQDRKIVHYVELYKTMLGLEVNKEKELWIDETYEMIRTQREENNYELLKVSECAMRYKRRKDPTIFIDSVFFPNLDQAGSIVRFMMYYLGKELLSSIGVWDLYEDPTLAIRDEPKNQTEKKTKKKKPNKPKPKKNPDKNQKPTAGTSENDDTESQYDDKTSCVKGVRQLSELSSQDDLPKPNWESLLNGANEDWIPADDKKKKAYLQKHSQQQPAKDSKKVSVYISDSEHKKTLSSKKKKKKSVSQTRSATSEGKVSDLNGGQTGEQLSGKVTPGKEKQVNSNLLMQEHLPSSLSSKEKYQSEETKNRIGGYSLFSESIPSDSNLDIRSSLASLETESINLTTEVCSVSKPVVIDEQPSNQTSAKSSKLRVPAKSKPFVHLEANNMGQNQSSKVSNGPTYPLTLSESSKKPQAKLKTRLFSTINEKDKKFFDYLNKDIDLLLSNMDNRTQKIKEAFACIHERIKKVVQKSFEGVPNLKSEVYGSYATNLLVDSSDMDICILGFEKLERTEAIDVLQTLSNNLNLFKWCSNINYIHKAAVPVIKLVNENYLGS